MKKTINDCYGCDSPSCAGCSRGNHEVECCDFCEADPEYEWGTEEFCWDCLREAVSNEHEFNDDGLVTVDGEEHDVDTLIDHLLAQGLIKRKR